MRGKRMRAAAIGLATVIALLALSQVALADAAGSFTVKEVDKAGTTVQVGTWTYDPSGHTLTGAPFVRALTSTDYLGDTLQYVPFSGQDAFSGDTKMAVATEGFYLDDLVAWVAAQNRVPLGGATQFNVTCSDTNGHFYYPSALTLADVDGRYWYPSYNYGADPGKAVWDDSTRVPRKAVLAVVSASSRRSAVTPAAPTDYTGLLAALGDLAASAGDSNSLQLWMGQVKGDAGDLNLGSNGPRNVDSLTLMPAYLTITPVVTGGAAAVATGDGFLKATAGEPVTFTIGDVQAGHQLGSVKVTDASGDSVTVGQTSGTYSFTMPSTKATIAVKLTADGRAPGRVTLVKVRPGRGRATVTWKRCAGGVGGYQVAYRKKGASRFLDGGTTRKLSRVVRGLRHGDRYAFRVRAYRTVDGVTYRGSWSRTRSVTVR